LHVKFAGLETERVYSYNPRARTFTVLMRSWSVQLSPIQRFGFSIL